MEKNDKPDKEPEQQKPKKPLREPEFPQDDLFTEGADGPDSTKDTED